MGKTQTVLVSKFPTQGLESKPLPIPFGPEGVQGDVKSNNFRPVVFFPF